MLRKTLIAACLLLSPLMLSSTTSVVAQPAANVTQKPFVHPLFSDNMVLQRDIAAPVWGWTTPGQRVTVSMSGKRATAVADATGKGTAKIGPSPGGRVTVGRSGKRATAVADATGKWTAKIGPFPVGGPHTLRIDGAQSVTL